jgi:hypothetical protein
MDRPTLIKMKQVLNDIHVVSDDDDDDNDKGDNVSSDSNHGQSRNVVTKCSFVTV